MSVETANTWLSLAEKAGKPERIIPSLRQMVQSLDHFVVRKTYIEKNRGKILAAARRRFIQM